MIFVFYIKQQINKYLNINNFKYICDLVNKKFTNFD